MNIFKRLSKREKILAAATAVVVLATLLYGASVQGVVAAWQQLGDEVEAKERLLARQHALIERADVINAEYANLSKVASTRSNQSMMAAQVLKRIQALASTDIRIENVKPLETKETANARVYEFELEGRVTPEQLVQFLYKTATASDAFRIRSLTLSPTRAGKELRYHMVIAKLELI